MIYTVVVLISLYSHCRPNLKWSALAARIHYEKWYMFLCLYVHSVQDAMEWLIWPFICGFSWSEIDLINAYRHSNNTSKVWFRSLILCWLAVENVKFEITLIYKCACKVFLLLLLDFSQVFYSSKGYHAVCIKNLKNFKKWIGQSHSRRMI